ncbi:hypothetical protein J7J47_10965 [Halomonas sp. ISL-60]|uniref:hypothetical protein n=1 Tax=Halomonas sp. ISL-56 TaxID=2819149 RepID=UPI001BE7296B|nr:hypothetical protein [Halomonas sp. ISL-56]MBT2772747.1 hypothetical protein [Halomonas sp. ISL-60]MBT2800542.1 hypothetical protein [Halomonas sp. ISL-56]
MKTKVPSGSIYEKTGNTTIFKQLARKIEMDHVSNEEYYNWLDNVTASIGDVISGAKIIEKKDARKNPPLNTAIYYDTDDLEILSTGALLRTSCNKITHAFCAFKAPEDEFGVRVDNRHVFDGEEKKTIQADPSSQDAISIVRRLMASDAQHPGRELEKVVGISCENLSPVLLLDDLRYTFYVLLDDKDALRCSIDRAHVRSLRENVGISSYVPVSEVEIAIYPRVSEEIANDTRLVSAVDFLTKDLMETFNTKVTKKIKYQRSAEALKIG